MPNIAEINSSLSNLEEELKFLSTANTLIEKNTDVAGKLIDEFETAKENYKRESNALIKKSKELSDEYLKQANLLKENFKKESDIVIKKSKELMDSSAKLNLEMKKLVKEIADVNFPKRLEKIDTSIVTINKGIANTQGRIESIESNLKDEIKSQNRDIRGLFNERFNLTDQKIDEFNKKKLLGISTDYD